MAIEINDVIRVIAKMSQNVNDIINVYHGLVEGTTAPTAATFLSAMDTFLTAIYDGLSALTTDNVTYDSIEAYNLTQDEYIGEVTWSGLVDGDKGGVDSLPPQTCPIVLFPTAVLRSQGRKFFPPFSVQSTDDDGSPDSADLAALAAAGATAVAGTSGTGWDFDLGNWNETLGRYAKWTSAIVPDFYATQRRRYLGSGS